MYMCVYVYIYIYIYMCTYTVEPTICINLFAYVMRYGPCIFIHVSLLLL